MWSEKLQIQNYKNAFLVSKFFIFEYSFRRIKAKILNSDKYYQFNFNIIYVASILLALHAV